MGIIQKSVFVKRLVLYILYKLAYVLPDSLYLKWMFYIKVGYHLDLKNPRTFNQKLQWLKLNDHQSIYTTMVDKVAVKAYVSKIIDSKHIIPTLGVWDRFKDIDFNGLPEQFVLKTSHGGGNCGVYICRNKKDIDTKSLETAFDEAMKQDIYLYSKEWAYKNVPHRILAEQYLEEDDTGELHDYKVFCFWGHPKLIEFHSGRNNGFTHTQDFYTPDWKLTNITQRSSFGDVSLKEYPRPFCLEEMLELSTKLSKDIAHCRIDWFVVSNKVYFGEITFFDGSGFCAFDNYEDDLMLGSWIDLAKVKTN